MATCVECDGEYPPERAALGYDTCLSCGERIAQTFVDQMRKCSAPLFSKGAYQPVLSLEDARNINSKYWRK